ncbi:hypothetical protein [Saccharothrix obliqua]|nr:hypothetical protein [Saccharothrix obliqua]MBW4721332.1 hypothetical protein [Saccharothrix obliqua]
MLVAAVFLHGWQSDSAGTIADRVRFASSSPQHVTPKLSEEPSGLNHSV